MKVEPFLLGERTESLSAASSADARVAQLEALVRELQRDLAKIARLYPPTGGSKTSEALYDIYRRNVAETKLGCPRGI